MTWFWRLLAWLGLWRFPAVRLVIEGDSMLLLTIDQKVTLTAQALDRNGNAARVTTVPTWTLTDASVGAIAPAADGMSAVFTTAALGVTQVKVSAPGLEPGVLDIEVESGVATRLVILPGVPEAK